MILRDLRDTALGRSPFQAILNHSGAIKNKFNHKNIKIKLQIPLPQIKKML